MRSDSRAGSPVRTDTDNPSTTATRVDPVCGMRIEAWETRYKILWKGWPVHFCSSDCKHAFELFPERFAKEERDHD